MSAHGGLEPAVEGLPDSLAALIRDAGDPARARPVERWDPAHCGEIDIRILADGSWLYRGTPIGREALVRLFASVLRREQDGGHVLVTPVEKLGIQVEDAPFLAVDMAAEREGTGRTLTFRTNVGDIVAAGTEHPLRFETEPHTEGMKPYLRVRGGLDALLTRRLAQEIVAFSDEQDGRPGVWSGGSFFAFPEPALG